MMTDSSAEEHSAVCGGVWHISCYDKLPNQDQKSGLNELESSGDEYVPDSELDDSDISLTLMPHPSKAQLSQRTELHSHYTSLHAEPMDVTGTEASGSAAGGVDDTAGETSDTTVSKNNSSNKQVKNKQKTTHLSLTNRNYCFICGKPQSRLTRHLKIHMSHPEVSYAFYLPEQSKERKILFEKMRNDGNFQHNRTILGGEKGLLKVKRKPKDAAMPGNFVHCMHCKGLYVRKELWRHVRRCPCRPEKEAQDNHTGRTRVLALATAQDTVFSQQFSSGMWKILGTIKLDEVGLAVRNDLSIVNFAQSLYNRHGEDSSKHEYMRQKISEVGRLLICMRTNFSIHSLEEAIKPSNFQRVVQAVKKVAGFDEENLSYHTPSLALKLGHALHKICDLIYCRALIAEDEGLIKSAVTFSKLYTSKWCELVSHSTLKTMSSAKYNKPRTLPFTEDVQKLHQYLQKTADCAVGNLMEEATSKNYAELAKAVLAQIIVFNRRRAGEVSKMLLRSFAERDRSKLHHDVARGLSKLEQKLCNYFATVEIVGKRGRKVVLLPPCIVDALSLLTSKRKECGVREENVFLFGRPQALTYYRGQDCMRVFASQCGAKHPELLRSTQLQKHVATLSQILHLKHNELDQVADFLGHDIHVHREFYRLPVPTTQLAKISKLLLSMDKGDLSGLQGRSLDEIEIEDEISISDTESKDSGSDSEDNSTEAKGPKDEGGLGTDMEQAHTSINHEMIPQVTSTAGETASSYEGSLADVPDGVSCQRGLKLQDHLHIKKEEEEPWERLEVKQETDIMTFIVKSEDEEEEVQCSLLHWRQSEENIKEELATCSSAELMKVEPNGDMSEGPGAANTCRQQDTDGEETDCSEDWREPLSQSEAQSEHMDMSCENFQTSEKNTKRRSHKREKHFGCDVCGKQFSSITHLKIHMRIHTGEKPFGCDICGKTFTRNEDLKSHMRSHTGENPSCEICGKQFSYKTYLKVHMRIHTGEKPFNCDVCGKSFTRNQSLRRHMVVHFGCTVCGKRFKDKIHLNSHMLIHSEEKPYKCDVCQKRFITNLEVVNHMRINADVCGKEFSLKADLKRRVRNHTGEKPVDCDVCGKRFASKKVLSGHMIIHTGEKPYVCDVCGQRFYRRFSLKQHMRTHTGD